jgi:hypothetical protein
MSLGIVVRSDDTGLGNQTRELVKMLNPSKILIIDSSRFHRGHTQHHEWYKGYKGISVTVSRGFPDNRLLLNFFSGINCVISCETFYSDVFVTLARKKRVKTILQYNFEFLGYMSGINPILPDVLLAPTTWRIDEVQERFGSKCLVTHLPPPTDETLFNNNMNKNKLRTNRLLHVGGKAAVYDRNGTNSVIDMLAYSEGDYELVIKSQSDLKIDCTDKRLTLSVGNEKNFQDIYAGYDAVVLPRRYAGLCLPMNEALLSGLPVFMTDISPNNQVLPPEWLTHSNLVSNFMAKVGVGVYGVDAKKLAKTIDEYFLQSDLSKDKEKAFNIGYNNFSATKLKQKYIDLINSSIICSYDYP